ncbi:MAG: hypothetical protein AAFP68_20825 [Pseudomonadota bacterium]
MSLSFAHRTLVSLLGLDPVFAGTGARAAVMTPAQGSALFRDQRTHSDQPGWDLIEREHRVRAAGGRILHLFGEVMDFDGTPVHEALVEIRQADLAGRTPDQDTHARDFRGHGAVRTDREGRYQFRTILPRPTADRTAHIHARVVPPSGRVLVTQLYLVDEAANDDDWTYQSLGPSGQAALSLDPIERADGDLGAGFNFVL